jgi:hypothetical protein
VRAALLALALLVACEPTPAPEQPDRRGEAGELCRPDGSCISPLLKCVEPELYLGIPMVAGARCKVAP